MGCSLFLFPSPMYVKESQEFHSLFWRETVLHCADAGRSHRRIL